MVGLSFSFGVIGNIISVLMFLSPAKTFWRIVKHESTEEFESLPYICTLLSTSLWTYYGITKPDYLVSYVNAFGVLVQIIYLSLFLRFAPPAIKIKTVILSAGLNVGFFAGAVSLTYLMLHGDKRIYAIGFMASALNIIMYGSPLISMRTVVRTRSVEYMPFPLSFCLFLNGVVWTSYAVLVGDWFIGVPNGIGFVFGTFQLMLYAIYYTFTPSPSKRSVTKTLLPASQQC